MKTKAAAMLEQNIIQVFMATMESQGFSVSDKKLIKNKKCYAIMCSFNGDRARLDLAPTLEGCIATFRYWRDNDISLYDVMSFTD